MPIGYRKICNFAESELNISITCGGGADAKQNFLESERMRSQKMRLRPCLGRVTWALSSTWCAMPAIILSTMCQMLCAAAAIIILMWTLVNDRENACVVSESCRIFPRNQ